MSRQALVRRAVLGLACGALVWAAAISVTGGFVIDTPLLRFSSRAAIRPLLAGLLLLLLYAVHYRTHLQEDLPAARRLLRPRGVAGLATIVALIVGFTWSTRIAGGPDASGYVSHAALLARGELTLPAPEWVRDASWTNAAASAAPVGYTTSVRDYRYAPVYAPGLPLLMALFQLAGGAGAVFAAVPLLGALAVWATFRLGSRLSSPGAGALAAVLLVSSPAFLFMTLQPMSDVPAAACWTIALASALGGRGAAAGLAVAAAILIRPNTAPLAFWPGVILWGAAARRPWTAVTFAAPVCLAAGIIAALNEYHHGSPLTSGYGALAALFAPDHILPNARQYAGWFAASQTVLPVLGLLAPFVAAPDRPARLRVAAVSIGYPATVLALYLPYVYELENWTYLRFLLPAYPALLVGFSATALALAARTRQRTAADLALAAAAAALVVHGLEFAARESVFQLWRTDQRYARVVAYVNRLPARSVIVSVVHSGTVRFYTGRDVLRFDLLDDRRLDAAAAHLEGKGYRLFLAGDDFEVDAFRRHFAGARAARLDSARGVDLAGAWVYPLIARD